MRPTRPNGAVGLLASALFAFVGLWGASCTNVSPLGNDQAGSLNILITDKPFPFEFIEEAVITVTRVEVHCFLAFTVCAQSFDPVPQQRRLLKLHRGGELFH